MFTISPFIFGKSIDVLKEYIGVHKESMDLFTEYTDFVETSMLVSRNLSISLE